MRLAYFEFICVSLFLPKPKTKKALGRVPSRGPTPSFALCSDSSMIVDEICSYLLIYVFILWYWCLFVLFVEMFFIWYYVELFFSMASYAFICIFLFILYYFSLFSMQPTVMSILVVRHLSLSNDKKGLFSVFPVKCSIICPSYWKLSMTIMTPSNSIEKWGILFLTNQYTWNGRGFWNPLT